MPYRITPLVNGQLYHVFNRGVEKRDVFTNKKEYAHFLEALVYYQQLKPQVKFSQATVEIKENLSNIKLVENEYSPQQAAGYLTSPVLAGLCEEQCILSPFLGF